jgi:hypothetical protein
MSDQDAVDCLTFPYTSSRAVAKLRPSSITRPPRTLDRAPPSTIHPRAQSLAEASPLRASSCDIRQRPPNSCNKLPRAPRTPIHSLGDLRRLGPIYRRWTACLIAAVIAGQPLRARDAVTPPRGCAGVPDEGFAVRIPTVGRSLSLNRIEALQPREQKRKAI